MMPGIVHPGSTGVIYCTDRAIANGFSYADSHSWSNMGQGAPEVGPIPDAPPRPTTLSMHVDELEYAPTTGVKGLFPALTSPVAHPLRSPPRGRREHVQRHLPSRTEISIHIRKRVHRPRGSRRYFPCGCRRWRRVRTPFTR